MALPLPYILIMYYKLLQNLKEAYDRDVPIKHFSLQQLVLLFPLIHLLEQTIHLLGNQSLHIYQNRKVRFQTLWNQRIFLPDVPLHMHQMQYGKALKSVLDLKLESLVLELLDSQAH